MKLFQCQACGQLLYFENTRCERCGRGLGYLPRTETITALEKGEGAFVALAEPDGSVRFCANAEQEVCNWLIAVSEPHSYCLACRHNRTIPDLSRADNLLRWRDLETAKHRLFYTLLRLRLPLHHRPEDPTGLAFDFLADEDGDGPSVLTGHDEGLITINIAEADDTERERRRTSMGEPYRTLLGHLRHEVGHHYWNVLIRNDPSLEQYRRVFGDEREDYGEALKRHYETGAPANWRENFVSAYATSHPWEDFAETWAHYLHMVDTLETAHAFGLHVQPAISHGGTLHTKVDFDPYRESDINRLIEAWLPLTFAVNSLNRSMGQPDLYPFVLPPAAVAKVAFIHERLRAARRADEG